MNNFNNATVPFEDSLKVKNKFQYGAQKSLNHQEIINADYHLLMFKKDELNGLTKETDNNNNVNKDNEDHNVPSTPIATRTLDNLFSPILNDTIRFASGRPKRYICYV